MKTIRKILVIQTAFIGDAILATSVIEKLHHYYPRAKIHFMLRKGNEGLFAKHPFIKQLWIWDKANKYSSWWQLLVAIRKEHYDVVVNLQRFGATGLLTVLSGAKTTLGFQKNPFSFLFTERYAHETGNGLHEIERNQKLIEKLTDGFAAKPKLYPSQQDCASVAIYMQQPYVCMAPASVWATKQLPESKWIDLIQLIADKYKIYLLGSNADIALAQRIATACKSEAIEILCGKLSLLQSAALMQQAAMNYVNDSAPLHLASAVNAPVTAFFCSTVPAFGFGPLSDKSFIFQCEEKLPCRPCGLHGKKACPKKHFACGYGINVVAAAQF